MVTPWGGWFDSPLRSNTQIHRHMENFVPTSDVTQTPVGSILVMTNRFHLCQMVLALIRDQGFTLKGKEGVSNRFIVECDLTNALTDMNIMEAKAAAMDSWVDTFHWLTDILEGLPDSLRVPAMMMTTWDGSNCDSWHNPTK